jgi:hypothetical protein
MVGSGFSRILAAVVETDPTGSWQSTSSGDETRRFASFSRPAPNGSTVEQT